MICADKPLSEEILQKLEKHGIFVSDKVQGLSPEEAILVIGQTIIDRVINEINELIDLWKELFSDYKLKDFKASEKQLELVVSNQDCAGLNSWHSLKGVRTAVNVNDKALIDAYAHRYSHLSAAGNKSGYRRSVPSMYGDYYQFPARRNIYHPLKTKLPRLSSGFLKLDKKGSFIQPQQRVYGLYSRQRSNSAGLSRSGCKSLESYFNKYKGVDENRMEAVAFPVNKPYGLIKTQGD